MVKRAMLISFLLLTFLAACDRKEPVAPPAPQTAAPEPMPAEVPVATVTLGPGAAPAKPGAATAARGGDTGKQVYDRTCSVCHAPGLAGAPRFGDKALWAPRIAQGIDTLYAHSIKGFQGRTGVMPPKGGNATLSDADVKAAVDYMVAHGK